MYSYYIQDNATAQMTNFSVSALEQVFGK